MKVVMIRHGKTPGNLLKQYIGRTDQSLADEGIIKGTSENTFSPASNITRADFAILLVRAFKLESENTENFADVSMT